MPIKKKYLTAAGFSLVEMLLSMALMGGLALVTGYLATQMNKSVAQSESDFWLEIRRDEIVQYISNDLNWPKIVNDNPELACLNTESTLTCPTGERNFRLKIGNVFDLDGAVENLGLTRQGDVCTHFDSAMPSASCPYGVKLKWKPLCSESSCKNPEGKFFIQFSGGIPGGNRRDWTKFNIHYLRAQKLNTSQRICLELGGVWDAPTKACQVSHILTQCPAGEYLSGFTAAGTPICQTHQLTCPADSCGIAFDSSQMTVCLPKGNDCSGSWSACSNTCGAGVETFTVAKAREYCGKDCLAVSGQTRVCNDMSGCPVTTTTLGGGPGPTAPSGPSCSISNHPRIEWECDGKQTEWLGNMGCGCTSYDASGNGINCGLATVYSLSKFCASTGSSVPVTYLPGACQCTISP